MAYRGRVTHLFRLELPTMWKCRVRRWRHCQRVSTRTQPIWDVVVIVPRSQYYVSRAQVRFIHAEEMALHWFLSGDHLPITTTDGFVAKGVLRFVVVNKPCIQSRYPLCIHSCVLNTGPRCNIRLIHQLLAHVPHKRSLARGLS